MTFKPTVILLSIVLILPVLTLSQSEMAAKGDWSVKCVDGVDKDRTEIPCENFSGENGNYVVVRDLAFGTDNKTALATLIFKRLNPVGGNADIVRQIRLSYPSNEGPSNAVYMNARPFS